jgi:2-amino-4-hydroxy-6-hydroxymethyldihydropteridine diphosphokinase
MIYLNIGSNLFSKYGNRFQNINKAIKLLSKQKINILKKSSFYETPSYPKKNKPKFINLCIKINTKLSPKMLLKKIKKIEKDIGRKKTKKNEPRVCDIDIIAFNRLVINKADIQIPHSKMHLRNFVLYPLKELDSKWRHPFFDKKIDVFLSLLSAASHNDITKLKKNVIDIK